MGKVKISGENGNDKDLLTSDIMSTATTATLSGSGSKELIDLEVIVLNWAKQIFNVTKSKAEGRINKKFLQVTYAFLYLHSF